MSDCNVYEGYGIALDSTVSWKDTACSDLLHMLKEKSSDLYSDVLDSYKANEDEYSSIEEFFGDYCEYDYSGEYGAESGMEGLLTAFINDQEFDGNHVFVYEDYVLHVPANIPENEEGLKKFPTRDMIRKIIREYINPLLQEDVPICWHKIRIY